MSADTKKQYTYADYEKLPEGAPYQLIGGDLIMTPAPKPYHQIISRRLVVAIATFAEERALGEVIAAPIDVYFSQTETYQPDIIFIAKDRLGIIGETKIEAAPDLVLEILSPSTGYHDLTHKRHIYEAAGVREYWLVDPLEKSIVVYENIAGEFKRFSQARQEGKVFSKLLPGFLLDIESVF